MKQNAHQMNDVLAVSGTALRRAGVQVVSHPYFFLLAVYLISVVIRIPFVFATGELPFIFNDEMRYMHIAKSVLSGDVLIRNQPVFYPYILYPLVISPLYWLPEGINIFRVMQVMNVFLMHSMIFPLYALSLKITENKRSALFVAVVSLLLPDTTLIKNIMTESLTYPMMFLTFLFLVRMLENPDKTKYWIRAGVFCFLLYLIKPVYASLGAACFVVVAAYAIGKKDHRVLKQLIWFAISVALSYLLFLGVLKFIFHMNPFGKTHYDAQNNPVSWGHLLLTIKGMLLYGHYHLIAFFLLPVVVLLSVWQCAESKEKILSGTVLLTLLFSWLCTVYVIYVDEVNSGGTPLRVHVRYTAMFFPIMLAFLFSNTAKGIDLRRWGTICLSFLAVGLALYDVSAFLTTRNFAVDAMMMSPINIQSGAWDGAQMYLPIVLSVLLPMTALAIIRGYDKRIHRALMIAIVIGLCANHYAAYTRNDNSSYANGYVDDAEEVVLSTGGDAWMICPDGQEEWPKAVAIDVASRCEMPVISFDALLRQTQVGGTVDRVLPDDMGKYVNIVPTYPYELGSYMIFDADLLKCMVLYDQTESSSDGIYAYVPVAAGEPWIHSLLYGLNQQWVQDGSSFTLYDAVLIASGQVTLKLYMRGGVDSAVLTIYTTDGQTHQFIPGTSMQWIDATFDVPADDEPFTVYFSATDGNIYIDTYRVGGISE